MRLWRQLAARIVFVSVLVGALTSTVAGIVASRMALEVWAFHMGDVVAGELRRDGPTACLKPRDVTENGTSITAYDALTLEAAQPNAAALKSSDVHDILGSRSTGVRLRWVTDPAVEILVKTGTPGPCGIYRITWNRSRKVRLGGLAYVLLLTIVPIVALGAVGTASVVRPLVIRIARQRSAAASIGTPAFRKLKKIGNDELSDLDASINAVHDRVMNDAQALLARQTALERHLANVAHDLRTPIAALQLSVEAASTLAHDPTQRELLTNALSESVYLTSLVENLWVAHQLSDGIDIKHGNPHCDLVGAVQQIEARFQLLANRKDVSINVAYPDTPVLVRCRSLMAQQAVSNLVQNALQHVPPGSHIAVILTERHHTFELTILDDGPGVKPHELPRLADRAFRSDDVRTRDPFGGGLGLAITREVCEQFGFSLDFANEEPHGFRVTIRGPCSAEPQEPEAPDHAYKEQS